jgi:hypothetical protein
MEYPNVLEIVSHFHWLGQHTLAHCRICTLRNCNVLYHRHQVAIVALEYHFYLISMLLWTLWTITMTGPYFHLKIKPWAAMLGGSGGFGWVITSFLAWQCHRDDNVHIENMSVEATLRREYNICWNLFIDWYFFLSRHVFYVKRKRVGREQTSGERERERERQRKRDRVLLRKGCGMGHKLDNWSSYLWGLENR